MASRLVERLVLAVGRRYPLRRGRGFFSWALGDDPARIPEGEIATSRDGMRFRLHQDGMYLLLHACGLYEPDETQVVRQIVRPGDVCMDVGANFGWYSVMLGRLVGPAGEVHAFEPVPAIARLTEDSIALNHLGDVVRLSKMGLGDEPGELTVFTFPGLPHGHASASDLGRTDAFPNVCRVTTMDEYVASVGLKRVDFIKIDVEGFEREVLRGGRKVLGRPDAPLVAFEVNRDCLRARDVTAAEVQDVLGEAGYLHFWEIGRGSRLRRIDGKVSSDFNADYLAAKPARLDRLNGVRIAPGP